MTHLFTVLFFGLVLGASIATLWSVIEENADAVLANLPWRMRQQARSGPPVKVNWVRGRSASRRAYCATPSNGSDSPMRAITVSPAMVR